MGDGKPLPNRCNMVGQLFHTFFSALATAWPCVVDKAETYKK